ncbi:hypothetical protein Hanom_Chr04g00367301 [Helianthus anomalus]
MIRTIRITTCQTTGTIRVTTCQTTGTIRVTFIRFRDYPSNNLSNRRDYECNSEKLRTKGEISPNHRDYPCILLFNKK